MNKIFINNKQVKEEVLNEILKYFELNEKENIIYENIWDIEEVVFRGVFMVLNVYSNNFCGLIQYVLNCVN